MWKRILWIALAGIALLLLVAFAGLVVAHRHIESFDPALPDAGQLSALQSVDDAPARLSVINTAAQRMPRSAVLEPSLDPDPDEPYTMSHASFVLEWEDGRILLIDAGMGAEAAEAFGAPMELGAGADAIVPLVSVADALGDAADRVAGIAFTHMHTDHTQGIGPLCQARDGKTIPVFQTSLQIDERNYTTRSGHADVEAAGCAESQRLEGGPLMPIPGFPGVAVFAAAGHTPGSQVFVASVGGGDASERELWLLVGDVVNHAAGIESDLPKPHLYSLLIVPESGERLGRVRRMVRDVAGDLDAGILVTHDLNHLEAQGLPAFAAQP